MKWVRCPSCRTLSDVHRYLQCDGCSRDLTGVPPAASTVPLRTPPPAVRDGVSSKRALWVVAFLVLVGTIFTPIGFSMITAFISFIMLMVLFANLGVRLVRESRMGTVFKVFGVLFAVVAGFAGAALLVALVCAANLNGGGGRL